MNANPAQRTEPVPQPGFANAALLRRALSLGPRLAITPYNEDFVTGIDVLFLLSAAEYLKVNPVEGLTWPTVEVRLDPRTGRSVRADTQAVPSGHKIRSFVCWVPSADGKRLERRSVNVLCWFFEDVLDGSANTEAGVWLPAMDVVHAQILAATLSRRLEDRVKDLHSLMQKQV
jgi:hypothetical protein